MWTPISPPPLGLARYEATLRIDGVDFSFEKIQYHTLLAFLEELKSYEQRKQVEENSWKIYFIDRKNISF